MVELQTDNYEISRKLFGKDANIFCGSFLRGDGSEPKWMRNFKDDKGNIIKSFDIIMGNPPFHKSKVGKRKGGHGGNIPLWEIFIKECIEYFKNENSYLCFINPADWRKPEHKLWVKMTQERNLHFIKILNEDEGKKQFDASTKPDLYILQNKQLFKKTDIIDENGEKHNLDLKEWIFLPNSKFKSIKKILTRDNGINVIYDTFYHGQNKWVSKNKLKYEITYTVNENGINYRYTNDNTKGHFGVPKVILCLSRYLYPINDYEGKYGMSEATFGIPISSKKEGDNIVNAINTTEFKGIIKSTKWAQMQTDYRMFKYFKKDFWKEFVDENGNVLNNSENKSSSLTPKTKKKKFIVKSNNTPLINDEELTLQRPLYNNIQNRKKLKKDKPPLKPKPSPNVYCPKIKTKKDCEHMKKCSYKDGKCSVKKIIKFNPKVKADPSHKNYDGPHKDKFLKDYTKKFGSKKYNSLDNAKRNANTNNTVGGITKSKKGKFTIRKGRALKDSTTGETSWLKKLF